MICLNCVTYSISTYRLEVFDDSNKIWVDPVANFAVFESFNPVTLALTLKSSDKSFAKRWIVRLVGEMNDPGTTTAV